MTDTPEASTNYAGSPAPGIFSALIASNAGVHEGGVHGSVLSQTRDLVEAYIKPELASIEGIASIVASGEIPAYLDRSGVHVIDPKSLEPWSTAPRFRQGTATLFDIPSFIGHINRYKDTDSIIFADNNRAAPKMTAVLDYHEAGAEGTPRFGKHRSHYAFPLSDQWQTWLGQNGKQMEMVDFARFLEDHVTDILPPEFVTFGRGDGRTDEEAKRWVDMFGGVAALGDPSTIMQVATGLQVSENSTLKSESKLSNGTGTLVFTEEHDTSIKVPAIFALGLPVFNGGEAYRVLARLRYRKLGGRLVFFYELWRTDLVFDDAFNGAVEKVQAETDVTVWLGRDENSSPAA